jgi:hypothetical protein
LKVLWRDHNGNLEVRKWINKLMKRRKGFNTIERLAWEHKWPGAMDPAPQDETNNNEQVLEGGGRK